MIITIQLTWTVCPYNKEMEYGYLEMEIQLMVKSQPMEHGYLSMSYSLYVRAWYLRQVKHSSRAVSSIHNFKKTFNKTEISDKFQQKADIKFS